MQTDTTERRILTILRGHADELKQSGLAHLHVFSSVARNDNGPGSDMDLIADFSPGQTLSLIRVGSIQQRPRPMLECEVELSTTAWMHEQVRASALAEAVLVF